jgi:hypothetical protein
MFSSCVRVVLALAIALAPRAAPAASPLPALSIDEHQITVSGISSGGYMAVQFHIAHSSIVRGAGVLTADPYYCAQGSAWTARYNCMQPGGWTAMPGTDVLITQTQILARGGLIDDPANLRTSRVWLFSGRNDDTVRPAVVDALADYYSRFVPPGQIGQVRDVGAGHAMVTTDYGSTCSTTASPYLNDCDFDAAGVLLAHLYGSLLAPSVQAQGELVRFVQGEFAGSPYAAGMDEEGFVYVPQACRAGGCRAHVAFHGCRQGREQIDEQFVRHAGYNRWADTNRIVVLYPQVIARYGWGPWPWPTSFVFNPNGCWDWWGYTGVNYHTKAGAQIRAVKAMLERLAARP